MMVEKVFFQKPEEDEVGNNVIDLRKGNPYTFFMVGFCVIFYIPNINYKRVDGNSAKILIYFLHRLKAKSRYIKVCKYVKHLFTNNRALNLIMIQLG
jgi:hypothetical protein